MLSSNVRIIGNYSMFLDQLIGGGCFGQIYLGCETSQPELKVAIKHVKIKNLSSLEFQNYVENETKIFLMISHPNIIKYYDSVKIDNDFYLILEYCSESLSSYATKFPKNCIPEKNAMSIIKEVALALSYLNSKMIVHRNLYPNNLLFQNGIVKICSFSFATIAENLDQLPGKGSVGTPSYEAPEIYYKKAYSYKCDIWSLGLIFYQMLYGKLPWISKGLTVLFDNISKNELIFPEEPKISENLKNLLKEMLCVDVKERCDWVKILEYTMGKED